MPFKAYLPVGFTHPHEHRMFHELVTNLHTAFGPGQTPVFLIGNVMIDDKEIDALLLKPDALFVIEMKDYGGRILLSENTEWFADDVEVRGGAHGNPYRQLRTNKFAFLPYLQRKAHEILNQRSVDQWWHVCGLVLFGRPIQFDERIPEAISDWFTICDQRSVTRVIPTFRTRKRVLHAAELERIVGGLGLTENHIYAGTAQPAPTANQQPADETEAARLNVLYYNQSQFRAGVLRMRQAGGRKAAAVNTLLGMVQDAREGLDSFATVQIIAESRIENAVIYVLNEEARCVAVKSAFTIRLMPLRDTSRGGEVDSGKCRPNIHD